MKKIFNLALAEFNKIFYRPSIFILTALLIIALVVSNLFYSPTTNSFKLTYTGENVSSIYGQFTTISTTNTITKTSIDNDLKDAKLSLDDDYYNIKTVDKLSEFKAQVESLNLFYTQSFYEEILKLGRQNDYEYNRNSVIKSYNDLRIKVSDVLNYMSSNLKDNRLNFYLLISDYDKMYSFFLNLHDQLPVNFSEYERINFIERGNFIFEQYKISELLNLFAGFEKIEINPTVYQSKIVDVYNKALTELADVYWNDISEFYAEHLTSNEQKDIDALNELIAKYHSYATTIITVIRNEFMLQRIGSKTDAELKKLVGYSTTSKYRLNEDLAKSKYLLENNSFDYDYLASFNFNTISGVSVNAFDYTFYTMQILSVLIIVFAIFYTCSSVAGDQSSGAMKMIAIRPYSRNKLLSGKYLSGLIFSLLLLAISFITAFIVGAISYSLPVANALVVFDATTVVVISPYLLLLMYFVTIVINILFYTSLAMFFSLVFKSNTLSVFLSFTTFIVGVLISGLISSAWLIYTPFAHLDLFRYFGNSAQGMLSLNVLPDTNFMTSAIVICSAVIVMNFISHMIFKIRNIA